jgi:hypothetical protein
MKLRILVASVLLTLATAAPAAGSVTAYQEPPYTKSNQNSFFFNFTRVGGTGPDTYYHCINVYKNDVPSETSNGTLGPGSPNCTGNISAASGVVGYQPETPSTVLTDGVKYTLCVTGYRYFGVGWFSVPLSDCGVTRIDRNKPAVTVYVNGTDTYTKNPNLTFRIDYSDSTSPPWPANYGCFKAGTPCTGADTFQYDPNCSVAASPNVFICSRDASSSPDGPLYFCAMAADSAIPDVQATNAFAGANSSNANISNFGCGSIVLDRVAPQVTAGANATTVKVGDLVQFSAGATDGTSGTSGSFAWSFGDNTAAGSGANVSHTYTQAGTFQTTVSTTDGAGNAGSATKVITVQAASTSGTGGNTTGGTPTGGGTTGGTPTGGSTTGGTATGGATLGGPTTANQIAQQVGGGGTRSQAIGSLDVVVPKRFTLRKGRRTLPLALSPDGPGKATVALLKGAKVVARAAATFSEAGTFGLKMRLPKGLKTGKYKLKIAFTAAGATRALSRTLPLKVVRAGARKASAAAATSASPRLSGGAPYGEAPTRARGVPRTVLG